MPAKDSPGLSPLRVAWTSRCPRCGQGKLYAGFLEVAERCSVCGLHLGAHDVGDAPPVFVTLIMGVVVVGLALVVEVAYSPALWVHALIWPPLILGGSLGLLRLVKSLFVGLHYRHRSEDFDVGE